MLLKTKVLHLDFPCQKQLFQFRVHAFNNYVDQNVTQFTQFWPLPHLEWTNMNILHNIYPFSSDPSWTLFWLHLPPPHNDHVVIEWPLTWTWTCTYSFLLRNPILALDFTWIKFYSIQSHVCRVRIKFLKQFCGYLMAYSKRWRRVRIFIGQYTLWYLILAINCRFGSINFKFNSFYFQMAL